MPIPQKSVLNGKKWKTSRNRSGSESSLRSQFSARTHSTDSKIMRRFVHPIEQIFWYFLYYLFLWTHYQVEYFSYSVEDFALYLPLELVPTRRVLVLRYKNRFEALVQSLVMRGVSFRSSSFRLIESNNCISRLIRWMSLLHILWLGWRRSGTPKKSVWPKMWTVKFFNFLLINFCMIFSQKLFIYYLKFDSLSLVWKMNWLLSLPLSCILSRATCCSGVEGAHGEPEGEGDRGGLPWRGGRQDGQRMRLQGRLFCSKERYRRTLPNCCK